MKHILIITIAAVVLVGCGPSEADRALLKATQEGNIKAVKQHLAAGADVHAKSKFGRTPLDYAAEDGHKEIAELLIAEGADLNAVGGSFGETPLHTAAWNGHKEVAELLIAKGADVNVKGNNSETPLDWAIRGNYTETADLLRKHSGKTGEELKAEGK